MFSTEDLNESAIQSIAKLTEDAVSAKDKVGIVSIPGDPHGGYLVVRSNGQYDRFFAAEPPRSTYLFSIDQIAPYVTHAIDQWASYPIVYYSAANVLVKLSEDEIGPQRAGSARVTLKPTPEFETLCDFSRNHDKAFLSHKAFMILLRIKLANCIDPQVLASTVAACQSYEAMEGERVQSMVTRRVESLGKEFKAELKAGAGEIPAELVLNVRLFRDPVLLQTRRIVCKLETDPTSGGRFALIPLSGEIEAAIDQETSEIGEMLRSAINGSRRRLNAPGDESTDAPEPRAEVPIFYGSF